MKRILIEWLEHSKNLVVKYMPHSYNRLIFLTLTHSVVQFLNYSGYISPEYATHGHFSIKSDVFSFGVLVLEILSGKKNRGFYHPDHQQNLLGHVGLHLLDFTFYIFRPFMFYHTFKW